MQHRGAARGREGLPGKWKGLRWTGPPALQVVRLESNDVAADSSGCTTLPEDAVSLLFSGCRSKGNSPVFPRPRLSSFI